MPAHDLQPDEPLQLEWMRYRREMDPPLRTGRTLLAERTGLLLRVTRERAPLESFLGEIAPLPCMGSESTADAEAFLRSLPGIMTFREYQSAAKRAGSAGGFGMQSCWQSLPSQPSSIRSAALLELDEAAPSKLARAREAGFRTFKLKCGFQEITTEVKNWECLREGLREGDRLRLDPNQAWRGKDWENWKHLLRRDPAPVEFIEEPFPTGALDARQLLEEAFTAPVPLALDESLSGPDGRFRHPEFLRKWPGWLILKPFLIGFPGPQPLGIPRNLSGKTVFSSVFETGIGLSRLIHLANHFAPEIDHGLDTGKHFNDELGLGHSGPRLHALTAGEEESLWTTLPASWKQR
ncbi:MAG: o-succinylbenzoate synthase [Verrucomicrobia bacterium]|jgi:o-succinylbenzoate synthase|nr:o-succinylbenzoate synthase [Verrucomicrobiota bacterium]